MHKKGLVSKLLLLPEKQDHIRTSIHAVELRIDDLRRAQNCA
jgi:hypothetical protein